MRIHWFPGHMTKALRMLDAELSAVDCVIYVLDARAPKSSLSPAFDKLIAAKPVLYVLNKADTVNPTDLKKWKNYFEAEGKRVVYANSAQKTDRDAVIKALSELSAPVVERFKKKGVNKTVHAMVIGVPNSGKSTLINSLIYSKKAVTGNRPGVTRGKQWVSIGDRLDLLDSPGVTYPDFSDEIKATRLAFVGSIRDEILDIAELGFELMTFLVAKYPDAVKERYVFDVSELSTLEIVEAIGERRGVAKVRGEPNYEQIGRLIVLDFRKQYFGKLILETPDGN